MDRDDAFYSVRYRMAVFRLPRRRKKGSSEGHTTKSRADGGYFFDDNSNASWWLQCAEFLVSHNDEKSSDHALVLPGPAPFFIEIVDRANVSSELLLHLQPSCNPTEIVSQMAISAKETDFQKTQTSRIQKIVKTGVELDWSIFIEACCDRIDDSSTNSDRLNSLDALGTLRRLSPSATLTSKLQEIARGSIFDSLYDAHHEPDEQLEAAALCLLILENPQFLHATKNGSSQEGQALTSDLSQLFGDRKTIISAIDERIRRYGTFHEFVRAAEKNPEIDVVLKPVLTQRVRRKSLGDLPLSDIIGRLTIYTSKLEAVDKACFIEQLPDYDTFWEQIEEGELTTEKCLIANLIISSKHRAAERFANTFAQKAREFDEAKWTALLIDGTNPLPTILLAFDFSPPTVSFGDPLFQGLINAFDSILVSEEVRPERLPGWFKLLNVLDENRVAILLKDLKDKILQAPAGESVFAILSAGGTPLLTIGDFRGRPDDSVRKIVLPQIENLEENADWFKENRSEVKYWIQKADRGTREYVTEKMIEMAGGDAGSHASDVARVLNISLAKAKKRKRQSSLKT